MVDLVVRRIPEYGWGLFYKGTDRKAEGNEYGPWYETRKYALAAKPKVLAAIERAHACDATCLCVFCHGSRERDMAALRIDNERLRYVLRRLLDGEYGMDVAPDGAIACTSLRIYTEARDEAVSLLATNDGVRGPSGSPSGSGPASEACTSGSIPAPHRGEGERRPAGGAPKQRLALPSPPPDALPPCWAKNCPAEGLTWFPDGEREIEWWLCEHHGDLLGFQNVEMVPAARRSWPLGSVILGIGQRPPRDRCPVCEGSGLRGPQRWWGRSTCVLCESPVDNSPEADDQAARSGRNVALDSEKGEMRD